MEKDMVSSIDDSYVKWFYECSESEVSSIGLKGVGLAQMYNLKYPVPLGFCITKKSFIDFLEKTGLKNKIKDILFSIKSFENTEELDLKSKEIRNFIEKQKFPIEIEDEILDSYKILSSEKVDSLGVSQDAINILKNSHEPIFVAIRSSKIPQLDDLYESEYDSFLNVKGDRQVLDKIKKSFSSMFSSKEIYFRHKHNIDFEIVNLGVVVEKMIDSIKSGIIYSRDPKTGNNDITILSIFGIGSIVDSEQISPDFHKLDSDLNIIESRINDKKVAYVRNSGGENAAIRLNPDKSISPVLNDNQVISLSRISKNLEDYFQVPLKIEFAIDTEKIYIVGVDRLIINIKNIIEEKNNNEVILNNSENESQEINSDMDNKKLVNEEHIIEEIKEIENVLENESLENTLIENLNQELNQKSLEIIDNEIISEEISELEKINELNESNEIVDIKEISEENESNVTKEIPEDLLTNELNNISEDIIIEEPVKKALLTERIKLKININKDHKKNIISKSGINEVGFTNISDIINNPILEEINNIFIKISEKPMDFLNNPDNFLKEIQIIKDLGIKYPEKQFGILIPYVVLLSELKSVKESINDIKTQNIKLGIIVETPAACMIIEELCNEGVDFVLIGLDNLIRLTLSNDGVNFDKKEYYDALNPAILHLLKRVIGATRRFKIESSIFGNSSNDPEIVRFLFRKGISSISLDPKEAYKTSVLINELQKEWENNKETEINDKIGV